MLEKLTNEQKQRLANLCCQIDCIFTEEDNEFTEDNIYKYHESNLYKGIYDIMYELKIWC